MKKICVIGISMIALMLALAACSINSVSGTPSQAAPAPSQAAAVLTGKLVQIVDGSCLIADSASAELYTVSTKIDIWGIDNKKTDASALKAGQNVEVGYSGQIMESYPAQPYQPSYIKITGQGDDLVGFYKTVLNDLWNQDKGLNPDSGVLALDLTQVTNLTGAEKSALVYIVSNSYGLQGITGTFNELAEQGLIDKENLHFKNGMLFTVKITGATDNGFTFDVSKWRGGTGAFFFNDCKAVKNDGSWSYTPGSAAIA